METQNVSAMFEFCENVKISSSLAFNKMITKQIKPNFCLNFWLYMLFGVTELNRFL